MSPEPITAPAVASVAELEQWVREHRVTWEARPRRDAAQGQHGPAELELTLRGRCPGGHFPVGGHGYSLVYERLQSIALHVLESVSEARYRIDPFDAAVRLRPEEGWTPEVEFTLVLKPADGDPYDAGHARRLGAVIGSGLERLGVQHKHFRPQPLGS